MVSGGRWGTGSSQRAPGLWTHVNGTFKAGIHQHGGVLCRPRLEGAAAGAEVEAGWLHHSGRDSMTGREVATDVTEVVDCSPPSERRAAGAIAFVVLLCWPLRQQRTGAFSAQELLDDPPTPRLGRVQPIAPEDRLPVSEVFNGPVDCRRRALTPRLTNHAARPSGNQTQLVRTHLTCSACCFQCSSCIVRGCNRTHTTTPSTARSGAPSLAASMLAMTRRGSVPPCRVPAPAFAAARACRPPTTSWCAGDVQQHSNALATRKFRPPRQQRSPTPFRLR